MYECEQEIKLNISEQHRMDAFDDGFGGEGEVEVDPAAEFLAKEQEELGDIGEFPADFPTTAAAFKLDLSRGGSWSSFPWWASP